MLNYCVDRIASTGGAHHIHRTLAGCPYMPAPENRIDLGQQITTDGALVQAALIFHRVNGCFHCASSCYVHPPRQPSPVPAPR